MEKNSMTAIFQEEQRQYLLFDVKGGAEAAKRFSESLELFSLLANVADVKVWSSIRPQLPIPR